MQLRGGSRESGFKEPYKISISVTPDFLEDVIWQLTVSAPSARLQPSHSFLAHLRQGVTRFQISKRV